MFKNLSLYAKTYKYISSLQSEAMPLDHAARELSLSPFRYWIDKQRRHI
jgi:hypothetical protein